MGKADRDATRRALSKPAAFVVLTKGLALKTELTAARLRELLHYDPETGIFTRRVSAGGRDGRRYPVGYVVGSPTTDGYLEVGIAGRKYTLHRLAYLYMTNEWPVGIDHDNGIRSDNRWDNLRNATQAENMQNLAMSPRNTSGYPGVTWCKSERKWQAQIKVGGRRKSLGRFLDAANAAKAYADAKQALHTFKPSVRENA